MGEIWNDPYLSEKLDGLKPHHFDNVGLSLDIYVDTKGVNEDDPDDMFFQSDDEDEENIYSYDEADQGEEYVDVVQQHFASLPEDYEQVFKDDVEEEDANDEEPQGDDNSVNNDESDGDNESDSDDESATNDDKDEDGDDDEDDDPSSEQDSSSDEFADSEEEEETVDEENSVVTDAAQVEAPAVAVASPVVRRKRSFGHFAHDDDEYEPSDTDDESRTTRPIKRVRFLEVPQYLGQDEPALKSSTDANSTSEVDAKSTTDDEASKEEKTFTPDDSVKDALATTSSDVPQVEVGENPVATLEVHDVSPTPEPPTNGGAGCRCLICDEPLNVTPSDVVNHMIEKHKQSEPAEGERASCCLEYPDGSKLECSCTYKYESWKASLGRHIQSKHLIGGKKTHQCPHCPVACQRSDHLLTHMRKKHGAPPTARTA